MNPVDFIYGIAMGDPRKRRLLTPLGPLLGSCLIIALIVLALWVDQLLRLPKWPAGGPITILSWLGFLAGLGLMIWSLLHFFLAKGTPVPFNPPPKLVTSGPYAYVRNPMYDGAFLALLGLGLLLRSLSLVFIFVPSTILMINWLLRVVEEPELEKRLGESYLQYRDRIPRFLPRL